MRLILVRHGETEENKKDICQGQRFGTLSRKGISQAKKLARRLKKEHFDIIYCSDLKRTKQTLKEIRKYHPKTKVVYAKEIRESNKGIFEGKKHKEIYSFYAKQKIKIENIRPPGGESYLDLKKRAIGFYNLMKKKHRHDSVLLITHGGVIIWILMHVLGLKISQYKAVVPHNTAVSVIELDKKGKYKVHRVNCVEHL